LRDNKKEEIMIDFALKYQAVIFGSFDEITPSPDTLSYFIDKFKEKELIPSTFQEIIPPTGVVKNRFIFKSLSDKWNIEFGSDRLDIKKVNRDINVSDFGNKETFIKDVVNILQIIFEKYPRKANRISFVSQYFCKEFNEEKLNNLLQKISNLSKTFKKYPPVNWNHRYVTRIDKNINGKNELINFIGDINRVQGNLKIDSKIKEFDRIELKFDINTFQGIQDYRFSIDDLNDFYSKVYNWEEELLNEFLNLME